MAFTSAVPRKSSKVTAVLVVASNFDTTSALAKILADLECDFDCVADNAAALEAATGRHFDLIVTSEVTSGCEDLELLRKLRNVRPHTRLIILTDQKMPRSVIEAMREHAFSYFSPPFTFDSLSQMISIALQTPCWDDGIEVLSATPEWIRLLARGDKSTAERLLQFVVEMFDFPEQEKRDVSFALRELLWNAVEHGARFDPNQFVELSYVRAKHMVSCRVKDPGQGFSMDELYHAAVSNPPDNPIRHAMYREAAALRPGGYGILMAQHLVDELIYGEHGNDVLMIKYLEDHSSVASA